MKSHLFIISLLVLLCFSTGCAYWYQPGKSFNDCDQDLERCYRELTKYADMDAIDSYEIEFIKDCMKQKGYVLFTEEDLPSAAKRRDPEMKTFWLLSGVAGPLE